MRRPKLARDTVWLASSDGLAIVLGLIGQVILAKALRPGDTGKGSTSVRLWTSGRYP